VSLTFHSHLEPGGWVNQLEMDIMFRSDDGSLPETDILVEWSKRFQDIGENKTGKTFRIAERCKGFIENAGFINVVEKKYKVPVGPWSSDPLMKEIGRWNLMHCFTGAENWALHLLTQVLNVRVSSFLDPSNLCSGPPTRRGSTYTGSGAACSTRRTTPTLRRRSQPDGLLPLLTIEGSLSTDRSRTELIEAPELKT
jgi:hypothetical protein